MPVYKIYMRSFAPWYFFGELTQKTTYAVAYSQMGVPAPGLAISASFGGSFDGDGRGFSLETKNPAITARISAVLELNTSNGTYAPTSRAWCDESKGPAQGIGMPATGFGKPKVKFFVQKGGFVDSDGNVSAASQDVVTASIDYAAANPLVTVAPDIDASAAFTFTPGPNKLSIVTEVWGDQFPACEVFIEDPRGVKVFLGGFAPNTKAQIKRLFGGMNKPKEVWFDSEIVATVDDSGCFQRVQGGGSGSNSTGPQCENLNLAVADWNFRIMGSIPMPSDAP